ncbi:Uncharacterised protein [Vibrio cholerae]|nr:Uncharacterised protein [Vibrio cholerae]CSD23604.1 Uncharacterised protein [Vibrio cholerae]CSI55354.1 Uncharacterised protein [Vibrio cholerae]CSI58672.1 Uncharacterised protein [Vibrio cholerae]
MTLTAALRLPPVPPTNVEAEAPIASIANPERTEILPSTAKAIEAGLLLG